MTHFRPLIEDKWAEASKPRKDTWTINLGYIDCLPALPLAPAMLVVVVLAVTVLPFAAWHLRQIATCKLRA